MTRKRSTQGRLLAVASIFLMLASLLLAAPLSAQGPEELDVLRVDLRGPSGTVVVRPDSPPLTTDVTVDVDDTPIVVTGRFAAQSRLDTYTVLIVDDSTTADLVAGMSAVRDAALRYLDTLDADTRVMLVRGGGGNPEVEALVPFTVDHQSIAQEIREMRPAGGAVLWNSIARSADSFEGTTSDAIRNVVAVVASPGSASTIPPAIAKGNLLNANAALTVIAPQAVNTDLSAFETVTNEVNGSAMFRADGTVTFAENAAQAGRFHQGTVVAEFNSSTITAETSAAIITFEGQSRRVRVAAGQLAAGEGLEPAALITTSRFDVLRGDTVLLGAIAMGVVAALLFSFAMLQIFAGNDNSLNSTLALYSADETSEEQRAADDAFASVRSKIVEQVVERAESAAASQGKLATTTKMLEKAEIPMRVGEAMAVQIGIIMVSVAVGFLMTKTPVIALLFAIPAAILPSSYVKFRVKRRKKKLEAQLPDTLNLLASTLKAGYSFIQGIDAVGSEAEEPLAGEFRRTVNEARLGRDIDDALDDLAERVDSIDLLWAVVAIKIQREVGGNLAELLTTVADTMIARTRLRGEVRALTAEGRMSAMILLFLPIGVGLAMYAMNKEYIATLWSGTYGYIALGVAAVGMISGSLWMRKIIDIKV
ncbi:MAG: hypothetical protein HKN94_06600 [Acidimicrobiales bacterium]|nr:hypothetical protein [Acidimicrobiales bacterium]RZV45963.1 MAG: hypothetical protein EX269_08535 [Acidimicrobiales bacterium]